MSETNEVRTQTHTKPRTRTDAHENQQNKESAGHTEDMSTNPNRTRDVDNRCEHNSQNRRTTKTKIKFPTHPLLSGSDA